MDRFWQIIAGVLLTVVLGMLLSKSSKDITLVLTMVVCVMVLTAAFAYLQPVLDFIKQLQTLGQLDSTMSSILFKAVGIGIVTEIAVLICNDSGNSALGKTLQMLATVMILWLSLPLMQSFLELIQKIMGEI